MAFDPACPYCLRQRADARELNDWVLALLRGERAADGTSADGIVAATEREVASRHVAPDIDVATW